MKTLLTTAFLLAFWAPAGHSADLQAYTEELPPLNYMEGNKVGGFSTRLLQMAAKEAGLSLNVQLQPWARAYRTVMETPDTIIFSITRNPEREPLFHWIGPISPRHINLYHLSKRKDIRINNETDLMRYTHGALFESASARKLAGFGLQPEKGLDLARNDEVNLKKLLAGRVDTVAMLDWAMAWQLRQQGLPAHTVKQTWLLDGGSQYWFALNKDSSPDKVRRLQAALSRIIADGRLKKLRSSYMSD